MSDLENPPQILKLYKQLKSNDPMSVVLAKTIIDNNQYLKIYFEHKQIIKFISKVCEYSDNIKVYPDKREPQNIGSTGYIVSRDNKIVGGKYQKKYLAKSFGMKREVYYNLETHVGILWIYKNRKISHIVNSKEYRKKYDDKRIEVLYNKINRKKDNKKEKEKEDSLRPITDNNFFNFTDLIQNANNERQIRT